MKKLLTLALLAFSMLAGAQTRVSATLVDGPQTQRPNESPAMVVDGHYFTKWCSMADQQLPHTLILLVGDQPINLTQYGFVTGGDTHTYPSRNPIAWTLSGSNDKSTWTVLDDKKNNLTLTDENEQIFTFPVKDAKSYRYYKFEFKKLYAGNMIQLAEICLYK